MKTLIIVIALFVLTPIMAFCETNKPFNRSGDFGIFLTGQFIGSDSTDIDEDIEGINAEVELDNTALFGFGMEYNINQHLNMNMSMMWGKTDGILKVDGYGYGLEGESDVNIFNLGFNVDYNILKSRFTPVITAGIGLMDFNIDDSYADAAFGGTYFTYNVGAGFRWDVNDILFVKTVYKINWVELDNTDSPLALDGIQVTAGFKF